jgi:STE24 endopeptidase
LFPSNLRNLAIFSQEKNVITRVYRFVHRLSGLISLLVRFWLASRHIRHILVASAPSVPVQFAGTRFRWHAHRRAADYSIAKTKFSLFIHAVERCRADRFHADGRLAMAGGASLDIFGDGWRYQLATGAGVSH